MRKPNGNIIGVAGITLMAAILRLHAIAAKGFWLDETYSAGIARLHWPQFFMLVSHSEANMALYYVLLHFWIKVSTTEAFVRGLSLLFSVSAVPLIYMLGKRIFGNSTGLLAAWFLSINAFHIRYAQEARSYSMVIFLATLSTWLLVRNIQEPLRAKWGWYSIVSILMVYSHFFGVLVVVAHAAALLLERKTPWRDYAHSIRWIMYGMVPIAVFVLSRESAWHWIRPTSLDALFNYAAVLTGNGGTALVVLDALMLTIAAFIAWKIRIKRPGVGTWPYPLVFSWLLVPPILILVVSFVKPLFLARYLGVCLPALVLGIAAGVIAVGTAPRGKVLAWTTIAAISALCMRGTLSYYREDFDINREDWRSATAYILSHAKPGDSIFFTNFGRLPYEYYRLQDGTPGPEVLNNFDGAELEYSDFLVLPLADSIRDARPAPDRVWLIFFLYRAPNGDPDITSRMVRAYYGRDRRTIQEKEFPQVTVLLLGREGDAASSGR